MRTKGEPTDTEDLNMRHGVCERCGRRGLITDDTHRCLPGTKNYSDGRNARTTYCERHG